MVLTTKNIHILYSVFITFPSEITKLASNSVTYSPNLCPFQQDHGNCQQGHWEDKYSQRWETAEMSTSKY